MKDANGDKKFYNNKRTKVVERYAGQDPYRVIAVFEKELERLRAVADAAKELRKRKILLVPTDNEQTKIYTPVRLWEALDDLEKKDGDTRSSSRS